MTFAPLQRKQEHTANVAPSVRAPRPVRTRTMANRRAWATTTIARADHPTELEADAIASAIVKGKVAHVQLQAATSSVQAKGENGAHCPSEMPPVQEEDLPTGPRAGEVEDEEGPFAQVQAKAESNQTGIGIGKPLAAKLDARRGGGEPIPDSIRSGFESRLGNSLAGVRLHTDSESGHLARSIRAEAFTLGTDVYFAPGRYAPHTPSGEHLLAHELVHVVQQRNAGKPRLVQRYTLNGFDPAQTAEMKRAIAVAKSKVLSCSGITVADRADILRGLNEADFDYVADLGACGYTTPFTSHIQVGSSAFNKSACCDLESTLAHECGHAYAWMLERTCRNMECKCFSCC